MTISSTTRVAGPFTGNGTASAFPFAWKVFSAADLDVVRRNVTSGTDTVLVLNTDYTVTLNGNQNTNPGGTVTLVAGPLASGFTLTLTSDLANLQPTDLTNQGGFYPEVINDSLDRATIQIQQLAGEVSRSIRAPVADGSPAMVLPPSEIRSNGFLAFDGNGLPTIQAAASGAAPTSITRQVFSGTGSQTVFTLSTDPGAAGNSAQVFIGGVYQQRNTYTINGTTLTFSQAPVAGTNNVEFVNFLIGSGANGVGIVTLTGDVTGSGTGTVPAAIEANAVTFAKFQTVATDRLLGRDTAGTGNVEQISLGNGLAFTGSGAMGLRDTISVKDFGAIGDGIANDTAAIQAAIDYCVANKTSLYIPHGTYSITTLTINFGGSSLAMPKQIGFRIFGDGGGKEAFTGSSGTDGTVLVYAGSSGSAITFAGQLSASMRLEGFTVRGTALQSNGTGSTAIGINLIGAINHCIRDVVVTGFDIGLYAEFSYIGLHSNCRFTQNNVNCKFASACNSIVAEQVDYTAGLVENLAIETNTVNGTRNLTFVGCLFESAKVGIRINAETATVQSIALVTPYFENAAAPASPELVVVGYSSAGVASSSAFRTIGLSVTSPTYGGVTPGVMFKLNNCENVSVASLNIGSSANAFATTSTVRRVSVDGHSTFGGSMAIPLATGAFKNSLQRRANYNLVAGGNYLVAGGSYIMSAGVTSTLSYVNGEPIVEFTVATSTTGTVRFHVENIGNLSGSLVQILVAAQRGDSTVDLSADIYDSTNTAWSGTLMTGWSTTAIQTIGRTQTVPSSNTARNYIELKVVNSSPTLTKTFKLKGVYMLTRDAGPVVTDAIDVLSAMSGTADCDPSATVDVAFTNADDYRVIATPDTSGVTCYVTKSATSFDITCSANALVDYVVIPRIRVLQ